MTKFTNEQIAKRCERAGEIVHSMSPEVARFVFDEGVRYSQALQTATHALDARATQVATILFAAAALSASVIGNNVNVSTMLAVLGMALFILGGLISFRAISSTAFRPPGLPPIWWEGALEESEFSAREATSWAVGQQQVVIDHTCEENEKRGDAINVSLWHGFFGAVAVGLAAAAKALSAS